jgi:MinD-like ATPase involved in chromosome partitioning or flagellar assembly
VTELSVVVVDRTGAVAPLAADALAAEGWYGELAVAERPVDFGAGSARYDIVVLGPRELTRAGLTRAARYAAEHPASVIAAFRSGAGRDAPSPRSYGVRVLGYGAPNRSRIRRLLARARDEHELLRAETSDWDTEGAAVGHRATSALARLAEVDDDWGAAWANAPEHEAEPPLPSSGRLDTRAEATRESAVAVLAPHAPDVPEQRAPVADLADPEPEPDADADDVADPVLDPEPDVAGPDPAADPTPNGDLPLPDDVAAAEGIDADDDSDPNAVGAEPEPGRQGLVVTVCSATGGCGKTFLATNLAGLVARTGRSVLLVDLDLQFGEVAAALRIRHPYSVYDGLYDGHGDNLPPTELGEHLHELVARHALGFDVLTAPRNPALSDYVGASDADHVLSVVVERYDVVIVDTPPSLNEVVLTALDRSDVVPVLATLDVPSLKNLSVFLDTLRRLKVPDDTLRLVLNKVDADVGISTHDAQKAFDNRFIAELALDRAVSRSINCGTVVVDTAPRAKVSKQIVTALPALLPAELAEAPASTPAGERPSLWARLSRRLRPSRTRDQADQATQPTQPTPGGVS